MSMNPIEDKRPDERLGAYLTRVRESKGMSIEEVLLILGKPINIQKSAETVQYMYNTFTYVFFENGKVKSFMQ